MHHSYFTDVHVNTLLAAAVLEHSWEQEGWRKTMFDIVNFLDGTTAKLQIKHLDVI